MTAMAHGQVGLAETVTETEEEGETGAGLTQDTDPGHETSSSGGGVDVEEWEEEMQTSAGP